MKGGEERRHAGWSRYNCRPMLCVCLRETARQTLTGSPSDSGGPITQMSVAALPLNTVVFTLIPWQGHPGWRSRYPGCFKKWTVLIPQSFTSSWYTAHNQSQMWLDQRENKGCKEGFPPDAPTLLLQAWLNRDNNRSLAVQKIVEVKKILPIPGKLFPMCNRAGIRIWQPTERQLLNLPLFRWLQTIVAHFSDQDYNRQTNGSFFSP